VVLPQPATEYHVAAHSFIPPPWYDGEENQMKKIKLGGLIRQQTKRENNNSNTNRRIYKAGDAQCNFLTT